MALDLGGSGARLHATAPIAVHDDGNVARGGKLRALLDVQTATVLPNHRGLLRFAGTLQVPASRTTGFQLIDVREEAAASVGGDVCTVVAGRPRPQTFQTDDVDLGECADGG